MSYIAHIYRFYKNLEQKDFRINKHDYAIGCEAFMEVKIGHDRSKWVIICQDRSRFVKIVQDISRYFKIDENRRK